MTKHKGPILTLVGGLILAAVLMVLNLSVTNKNPAGASAANAPDSVAKNAANSVGASPTVVATTAAPTTPPPPPTLAQSTYAGKVNGNGATLAIAITGGKAIAYLCDGKSAEAWLQGTASGGSLDLTGAGGAWLTGTYGNGVAAGSVTAAGRQFGFSLKTVAPPSGLYRAAANVRNAQLVGGWIVLANGQQVGLVRLGENLVPAPPLDTANRTATVDGTAVTAIPVDGSGL